MPKLRLISESSLVLCEIYVGVVHFVFLRLVDLLTNFFRQAVERNYGFSADFTILSFEFCETVGVNFSSSLDVIAFEVKKDPSELP